MQRQEARKAPYDRILIVCEGQATEVIYFKSLIRRLRLHTANIEVVPSPSSCPKENVLHARAASEKEEWDRIYCVFDKDGHAKYVEACETAKASADSIVLANSVPCFEYWLLLHFEMSTASFYGRRRSAGDEAVSALRKKIPDYRKSYPKILESTFESIDAAVRNAENANRQAEKAGSDDPSTQVVGLVKHLLSIYRAMAK